MPQNEAFQSQVKFWAGINWVDTADPNRKLRFILLTLIWLIMFLIDDNQLTLLVAESYKRDRNLEIWRSPRYFYT